MKITNATVQHLAFRTSLATLSFKSLLSDLRWACEILGEHDGMMTPIWVIAKITNVVVQYSRVLESMSVDVGV